jgi:CPA1 family monovalent cation:H+ antiporter
LNQEAVIALSAIGVTAIACQWFAWWVKLPAIVFLLLSGIVLGPMTGFLNPEQLFGDLLFPFVSLAVAIILFEGSLTLKFDEIKGLQKVVRNMLTIGVLIAWVTITLGTHYIVGFAWDLSVLFGALMVVTGPTVIVPMLRTVRPNAKIANILRWEGIVIDPLGAILAVLIFEIILTMQLQGNISVAHTIYMFAKTLFIGSAIGVGFGYVFGLVLRKHLLPEYLHNVATLILVFASFTLANELSEESGLLTVTVMGIWLANMKSVPVDDILDFKESLSILLISGLFILLAARLDFSQFEKLGWSAVLLFLFLQFFARPFKVFIATIKSDLTWQEKVMISWIGPRGIVAAAVTALFALRLQEIGVAGAELLVPLAFSIIIGTVLLQGASSRFIANKLGVSVPDDTGYLIIGANPVARTVAKALTEAGFKALVSDASWTHIKAARMEGLDTYYGNPVSEHADRHLDLIGLGSMLTLTPQKELNALAAQYYKTEFSRRNIYYLSTEIIDKDSAEQVSRTALSHDYQTLFNRDITFSKLASLISKEASLKSTNISDSFDYHAYKNQYGKRAIPLFAYNGKRQLRFFTDDNEFKPEAGWVVTALIQEENKVTT